MNHGMHGERAFERHRRQGIIDAVGDLLTGTTTGRGVAGTTTAAAAVTTTAAAATTAVPVAPTTAPTTAASTTAVAETTTRAVATTAATTAAVVETTTARPTSDAVTTTRARTTTALETDDTTTAFVTVAGGTQAFGTGTTSLSSRSTASSTSLANSSDSGSGPTTGTVVGIVAGALVGVIILATIIGYLYRQKWGRRDEPEESPFDRDDFRRESVLLDDGNYDNGGRGSPQMSQYNNGGLGRSNSSLPGLTRNGSGPRPPTTLMNHYNHQQQMMPSFAPGQVVPTSQGGFSGPQPSFGGGYGGSPPPMELYGGYPMAPGQQNQLDRGLYQSQHQHQSHPYAAAALVHSHSQPQLRQAPQYYPQQATLERNPSLGSTYSNNDLPLPPLAHSTPSSRSSHTGEDRPLSLVKEESEPTYSRSGTPTNSNVQQSYFSHRHNESASSRRVRPESRETSAPSYETGYARGEGNLFGRPRTPMDGVDAEAEKAARAQRTLSVRNGGLDADEDPYGGYA